MLEISRKVTAVRNREVRQNELSKLTLNNNDSSINQDLKQSKKYLNLDLLLK